MTFKEFLSQDSPEGNEIWDNQSNAELNFNRSGAKSKNVCCPDKKPDKSDMNPEKLYLGNLKNKDKRINIISSQKGV